MLLYSKIEQDICRQVGFYNFKKLAIRETWRFQFYKINFLLKILPHNYKEQTFQTVLHRVCILFFFHSGFLMSCFCCPMKSFSNAFFAFIDCFILVNDTSNKEINTTSSNSEDFVWIHYNEMKNCTEGKLWM